MIEAWSAVGEDAAMADAMLVDLQQTVRRHPWWRARARLVLKLLNRLEVRRAAQVLDAGCGWGVTLDWLDHRGFQATGLDASHAILRQLDAPGRRLALGDLTRPLQTDQRFDAALALDVIEHLDDERAAVRGLARLLRPAGVLIVSVPARPEMFSEFDVVQGHRRRYTTTTLRSVFEGSGFVLEQLFWWGAWLVPLLKWQRGEPVGRPADSSEQIYRRHVRLPSLPARIIANAAFRVEEPLALAGWLPAGTSLFAVARKSDENSDTPG